MKKEIFKYLYSFKYNNKEYIYLISKNYPFYILEYNLITKSFDFPEFDIFQEIYKKFYSFNDQFAFDVKEKLKLIKEKLKDINIEVAPFIRTTSGLLSLAIALSMCGCQQVDNSNNSTSSTESSSIVTQNDPKEEIYNYFKNHNMDVTLKEYDNNGYIFVRHFINSNNKHQITLRDFDEFRDFTNINFIPSWDDVTKVFEDNQNIDNEKKQIIINGINNLKNNEELKCIDLSVLYANAKRMNIKYLTTEELKQSVNRETVYAYFDTQTGTVYLPSDKPLEEFEFIHEVLGHGTLSYREETDDALIVFDCTNQLMLPADNTYIGHSVGVMVSEGGANMIARLATDDRSKPSFYELYEEELRTIAALCEVSIGEMFNNKGIALYDLMYKNGIDTPVEYIFKMDGIYKGQLYCEFSDLMERLFVDATEEVFLNSNESTQDEIIKTTIDIIKDSHFKEREELNFGYPGGSINYNFEESATKYEENMNALRNSK